MPHFSNPILSGFHPDPSICRVGEDYYLTTSTFEYFPGLPIFHSRDLVHWRQIGHILDRPSQVPLQTAPPSGGIYAPTLRHQDGAFILITTNLSGGGNFVVTATDPAGPWSEPVWIKDAEGIDPSLFFDDDGRWYYTGNGDPVQTLYEGHHTIWMQELDRGTFQLIGEKRVIVDGGTDLSRKPVWIEGPHLYKIHGSYYLIAAEGGTGERHSVVVFRSETLWGPYVSFPGNPILTNRDLDPARENPITCAGHADLFQTQQGEWWMVLLACRPYAPFSENHYNTGRETFLVPMRWEDGWPVTRDGTGCLQRTYPVPDLPERRRDDEYGLGDIAMRDDFDTPALLPAWTMIRNPEGDWLDLSSRSGFLRLTPRAVSLASQGNPSFIGVRQRHASFVAATVLEFSAERDGEGAGLAIVQNNRTSYVLLVTRQEQRRVISLLKTDIGSESEVRAETPIGNGRVFLRIEGRGRLIDFSYSDDGRTWTSLRQGEDARILSTRHAGGFVGVFIGPYGHTVHPESCCAAADFDWFEYQGRDSA